MSVRSHTSSRSHARGRAVSTLFDDYFTTEDTYDVTSNSSLGDSYVVIDKEMTLLTDFDIGVTSPSNHTPKRVDYRWQWRHTISYWIAVGFIFGGILYVVGASADIFADKLSDIDYYTLNPVAYLGGAIAYLFAGYCSYHLVINETAKYNPNRKSRNKKIWCLLSGKKPVAFWASFSYLVANITTLIPKICRVLRIEFVKYSLKWYIITRFTMIIVYFGLFIGASLQLYLNKGWKLRPYKLGWIASWCDTLAGASFLVQGVISVWFVDENNEVSIFMSS